MIKNSLYKAKNSIKIDFNSLDIISSLKKNVNLC